MATYPFDTLQCIHVAFVCDFGLLRYSYSDSEHSVDNDCSDLDHTVPEEQTMPPELMDELNLLADRQIEFAKRFNLIIPDKSDLSSDEDT